MKILHVADLHLEHDWFDWVASHASDHDLLVIAGDLLDLRSRIPLPCQADAVAQWLLSLRTPTCVCTGNHDIWVRIPRAEGDLHSDGEWLNALRGKGSVIGVDGDMVEFGGLKIYVNGWLRKPDVVRPVDILLSHAPPSGSAVASGDGWDVGDPEIWNAVRGHPPALFLGGHIHSGSRRADTWPAIKPTTLVLVPGVEEQSEIPAHWVLDTVSTVATHSNGGTVTWDLSEKNRPWAVLKARSFGVEDEVLAEEGGAADDDELASRLGCRVPELLSRVAGYQLFFVIHRGRRYWPRWQLSEGRPLPGLSEALKILAAIHPSEFSIIGFFLTPTDDLFWSTDDPEQDGVELRDSPLSLLRRGGAAAVKLVQQHAERVVSR